MSNTLGEYLRSIREQNELSTRDVERKTGITTSQLSRIECSKTQTPSPIALKKLAYFYNIRLIELFQMAGYLDPKDAFDYLDPYFKGVDKLSQEDKIKIQSHIDYLIFQHEKEREREH